MAVAAAQGSMCGADGKPRAPDHGRIDADEVAPSDANRHRRDPPDSVPGYECARSDGLQHEKELSAAGLDLRRECELWREPGQPIKQP